MTKLVIAGVVIVSVLSTEAAADTHTGRDVGAYVKLISSGLAGKGELGFGIMAAPHRNVELDVSAMSHKVEGSSFDGGPETRDGWLVQGMVRGRTQQGRFVVFGGAGVLAGPHASRSGGYCTASGLINLCPGGMSYDTRSYAAWDRVWMLRLEVGAEVVYGPLLFRTAVGPAIPLNAPDIEMGVDPHGEATYVFDMSIGIRWPL